MKYSSTFSWLIVSGLTFCLPAVVQAQNVKVIADREAALGRAVDESVDPPQDPNFQFFSHCFGPPPVSSPWSCYRGLSSHRDHISNPVRGPNGAEFIGSERDPFHAKQRCCFSSKAAIS